MSPKGDGTDLQPALAAASAPSRIRSSYRLDGQPLTMITVGRATPAAIGISPRSTGR